MTKKINVKITSKLGHEMLSLDPDEAVSEISRIANEQAKFIFVDGHYVINKDLNREMLVNAKDISMTNRLKGGK